MAKAQKNTFYKHALIIGLLLIIAISLKVFYFEFSVFNAVDIPYEDHAWFNLMLYPLTPTISDKQAYMNLQKNEGIVHIDVRNSVEFGSGHISEAINIPETMLYTVIPQKYPDKNQLIYMNCNSGHQGAVSTRLLRAMGYTNVWNIENGLEGWKESGYPIVK